jgi:glutathione S-transferase
MENIPYHFKEINIFDSAEAVALNKLNPVNQIPVLISGETKIWDSRQIFNYLNLIHKLHNMDWEDENTLTALDGAMNSGVALLLMKRSGINTEEQYMFIARQKERIESVLDYLKPMMEGPSLKEWNFLTMTLYCFLDWAIFREIINLDHRPECQLFLDTFSHQEIINKTAIPRGK